MIKIDFYYTKIGQYLVDPALSVDEKQIDALLKRNKITDSVAFKEDLYAFLREYLTRIFKDFVLREYLHMEKTKNFGIKIMFARSKTKLQEIIDQFKEDNLSEEQKQRLKVMCKEKVNLL
jgi:L-lactate utilization protein LutB